MDAQVRVLELEKELEQERLRLSALRRHHYQLAGEGEGWVRFLSFHHNLWFHVYYQQLGNNSNFLHY